jgi:Zn-dependent protease with chaperone function
MTVGLAVILAVGISLPHMLRLSRSPPSVGVAFWLSSLALRALTSLLAAVYLVLYLPSTALFQAVAHWCWHTVLPLLAAHLGLDGHRIADAATVAPGLLLVASLLSVGIGVVRAVRSVERLVRRHALKPGPRDTVIVGGEEVILAAAGLRRPRVLVSAGALIALDDDELAAGLDHERGHIAHRHRYVLLVAQLCLALGRFLPGSRRAMRELAFQLERDADRWSLERQNDRLALASVIAKAARGPLPASSATLSPLGGAGVRERVSQLVDSYPPPRRPTTVALRCLAVGMVTLTVTVSAMVPLSLAAGAERSGASTMVRHCDT